MTIDMMTPSTGGHRQRKHPSGAQTPAADRRSAARGLGVGGLPALFISGSFSEACFRVDDLVVPTAWHIRGRVDPVVPLRRLHPLGAAILYRLTLCLRRGGPPGPAPTHAAYAWSTIPPRPPISLRFASDLPRIFLGFFGMMPGTLPRAPGQPRGAPRAAAEERGHGIRVWRLYP